MHQDEKQEQQQKQDQTSKTRPPPRKMDLSGYDDADDDGVSSSHAPESAATSDERVHTFQYITNEFRFFIENIFKFTFLSIYFPNFQTIG